MSDSVKSTLIWAGAVVLGLVIFVLIFRREIAALFPRIKKLGLFGWWADVAEAPPAPAKQVEAQEQAEEKPFAPALQPPESHPVYSAADADTRARLNGVLGADKDLQLAWAIRMFSMAAIERGHEMNYRLIFTSQLTALHALNQRGPQPVEAGRELYDAACEANVEFKKNVTWDGWVKFLLNTGYVHIDHSNPTQPIASLTPLGKHFLHFTVERGLSPIRSI